MRTDRLIQQVGICALLLLCGTQVSIASPKNKFASPPAVPLNFEPGLAGPSSSVFVAHVANFDLRLQPLGFEVITNPGVDVAIQLIGANSTAPISAGERQASESNYFIGSDPSKWRTHIPNFGKVKYAGIYPGTDLVFYGSREKLEYDFLLAPGADPRRIRLRFSGQQALSLEPNGTVKLTTAAGEFLFRVPHVYQMTPKGRLSVSGEFSIRGQNEVGLTIGNYDRSHPLVIDPVLTYSSYLAGSGREQTAGAMADSSGNVYVTGITTSADFPTQSAQQAACGIIPCAATFLSKMNPAGRLVYSTYLAGIGNYSSSIAVDPNGNVIVGGYAGSSNFPSLNSYATFGCCNFSYAFVLSVSPDGSQLNYSTLLGKTGNVQAGVHVAVDPTGAAYATGQTFDIAFPVIAGGLGTFTFVAGCQDEAMFVTKLKNDGTILYSTLVPGTLSGIGCLTGVNDFIPETISVDSNGNAYLGGLAGMGLPTTTGVLSSVFPSDPSSPEYFGFVLKLNPMASAITYATYLPGTTSVTGIAPDPLGEVFVGGNVLSSFQATPGAFQTKLPPGKNCTCNGGFVAHLNSGATAYLAATYLTGTPATSNAGTNIQSLALDVSGNVWVGGITAASDFPLKDPILNLLPSGFVTELTSDLSSDVFSTFLTGQNGSGAYNLFVAPVQQGVAWAAGTIVSGVTGSSDFPTTSSAFQTAAPSSTSDASHAFISKIDTTIAAASTCLAAAGLGFPNVSINTTSAPESLSIQNCGNADLHVQGVNISNSLFSQSSTCLAAIPPGSSCAIMVTFTPTNLLTQTGTLELTDDSSFSPKSIFLGGNAAFSLSALGSAPLSQTVQAGQTATYSLVATGAFAYTGRTLVNFSCTQIPPNATCAIKPSGGFLAGGSAENFTVSISVPATTGSRFLPLSPAAYISGAFALLGTIVAICFVCLSHDDFVRPFAFAVLLLAVSAGIMSCGGGSPSDPPGSPNTTNGSTPPGTYTIVVVASDGNASASLPLTLTVQ